MNGPFMRNKNSTSKIMRNLFIALLPIIIFSFYKNGIYPYVKGNASLFEMFYPLIFITIGSLSSVLIELLFSKIIKKEVSIKGTYALFPGLFLSLILPLNTPISILIFGVLMAVVVGKMLYGGFGHNIFNPALIGYLFVITAYSAVITTNGGYLNPYELDTISSATPLTNQSIVEGIGNYTNLVKPYGSLLDFFTGMIPGSIGETSALLCAIAFIYLVFKRVIKWKIPVIYIGTVFILTFIIGSINNLGFWYPTFQILSGGLFFGAVFMATDPVTSPTTGVGQILYAIALGVLTVIFRYLTPLPEGVATAILTMNMFTIILDKIGSIGGIAIKKIFLPLIIIIGIGIYACISIGNNFKYGKTENDPNFKIIGVKSIDDGKVYTVTQKGNGGPIKAEITIEDSKATKFEVLENNETDSYYKLVEEADYITVLVEKQNELDDVDTVSGATISSTALKKMIINVMKEEVN